MAKQMSAQEANWQAMFAPAGTPGSVIKSLNDASDRVLNTPEVLKNWANTDVEAYPKADRSRQPEAAFARRDRSPGQVIRTNNITID
jgi:tripartite-type tricarboxylate transporter receptor subunit TctC